MTTTEIAEGSACHACITPESQWPVTLFESVTYANAGTPPEMVLGNPDTEVIFGDPGAGIEFGAP